MPARLRSILSLGLSDAISALHQRLGSLDSSMRGLAVTSAAEHKRLDGQLERLQQEVAALRSLIGAQDERAQRKLRAGLSSAVNLLSVLPQLKIEGVLPPFPHQGFEITGELAAFLFHFVRRHRPRLIVELGTGSSTVLLAASARANGIGRVMAVEHDPEHMARTAQFLAQTELSSWVELVHAPLTDQQFGAISLQWYDLAPVLRRLRDKIDFLFIDGPPGRIQALSRYPAMPVLTSYLSPQALVLVDDGRREDEMRMIELWRESDPAFEIEPLDFLPRAPVLLKFGAVDSRITELRRAKEEWISEEARAISAERRSGFS